MLKQLLICLSAVCMSFWKNAYSDTLPIFEPGAPLSPGGVLDSYHGLRAFEKPSPASLFHLSPNSNSAVPSQTHPPGLFCSPNTLCTFACPRPCLPVSDSQSFSQRLLHCIPKAPCQCHYGETFPLGSRFSFSSTRPGPGERWEMCWKTESGGAQGSWCTLRQKSVSCVRLETAAGRVRDELLGALPGHPGIPSTVMECSKRTERDQVFMAAFLRKVNLRCRGDLKIGGKMIVRRGA